MNAMKRDIDFPGFRVLEWISQAIAFVVCVGLLIASCILILNSFKVLFDSRVNEAVQDGLFVLILLEMFYVVRSFMKYGSINVALVVSVGVIAAVKSMIFRLDTMDLMTAIGFGVLFVTLGVLYMMESLTFRKKNNG